jgi:hypothetical protein
LPYRGFFFSKLPKLAVYGIIGHSAGKYHLMDDESTRGMVILPGITSS